jgi:hypothetical protein
VRQKCLTCCRPHPISGRRMDRGSRLAAIEPVELLRRAPLELMPRRVRVTVGADPGPRSGSADGLGRRDSQPDLYDRLV